MVSVYLKTIVLVLAVLVINSCTAAKVENREPEPLPSLRIGVTADYPPIIFRQGGKMAGVEADLARRLAEELGKSVKFVELRWKEQIPSLMAGRVDMIMSGMSITKARMIRVSFSEPYLKSGLVFMMHIKNAWKYGSIESIKQDMIDIGVVGGTTSEMFVRKNLPNAAISVFQRAGDAPVPLIRQEIDIFIHDAPSIIWLVSENETNLTALWEPLNEEDLAWGLRKDDGELLMEVDTILAKWKKDGTLERILLRWLPSQYLERFR